MHLKQIDIPMRSGTRDALAELDLLKPVVKNSGEQAKLHLLDTAGHSYKILKKTRTSDEDVFVEMARVTRTLLEKRSSLFFVRSRFGFAEFSDDLLNVLTAGAFEKTAYRRYIDFYFLVRCSLGKFIEKRDAAFDIFFTDDRLLLLSGEGFDATDECRSFFSEFSVRKHNSQKRELNSLEEVDPATARFRFREHAIANITDRLDG
jgi:hypothetical protein